MVNNGNTFFIYLPAWNLVSINISATCDRIFHVSLWKNKETHGKNLNNKSRGNHNIWNTIETYDDNIRIIRRSFHDST